MERENYRREQALAEMKRQGDARAQEYEQNLKRIREDSRRDMEDMHRRHQMEISAASQQDDDEGGGFLGVLKTLTTGIQSIAGVASLFGKK